MPLDHFTREGSKTGALTRSAATQPATWDAEARTVDAVIATSNPVRRMDAQGPFLEVLDAATLDLSSAEGLAVIDSHRTDSGRHVLGRVIKVWRDGARVLARLQITAAQDAQWARDRIADGSLSGVSIGYAVAAWRTVRTGQNMRGKTPTSWRLTEVTLTSNPADPSARLRQGQQGGPDVDPEELENDAGQTRQNPPTDGQQQTRQQVEQARRTEIRGLVRAAGLDAETADDLIDQDASITEAKAAILDATQERTRQAPRIRAHGGGNDDPAIVIQRQADALVYRMAGGELADGAQPYVNATLRDLAVDALTRSGQSVRGMSADEIFHRAAHTTSDFPLVVSNAAGGAILRTFTSALRQAGKKWNLAGVKQRSAHGLRKSRARALAEAGGTSAQIGAWTGHESLSEIERYIRNFSKRKALSSTKKEQKVPTLTNKVPNHR